MLYSSSSEKCGTAMVIIVFLREMNMQLPLRGEQRTDAGHGGAKLIELVVMAHFKTCSSSLMFAPKGSLSIDPPATTRSGTPLAWCVCPLKIKLPE